LHNPPNWAKLKPGVSLRLDRTWGLRHRKQTAWSSALTAGEEVLQSHHFRSGEELETTLHRCVVLYNQQIPQSALGSKTRLQAMKDWHKLKPELFRKQPYHLPGCDK